jgi:hypothetical protein
MKSIVVILISLTIFSCGNKKQNVDEYYTDHGDWDSVRFPIVKPYEAICLNGSHDWIVQTLQDSESFFSAPSTRKMNVVNKVIFLYATNTLLDGQKAKEAWFILIPGKHLEKGFATHREYVNYLRSIGVDNEPKLYDMDQVSQYFGSHDTIDWKHIDEKQ